MSEFQMAMIRMYPKALVLTNRHPFGGTDMMAQSIASALTAIGYDPQVVCMNDDTVQQLGPALRNPDLRLVLSTGTVPLCIHLNGQPVWKMIPREVDYLCYIIDAWPYDQVRVQGCRDFLRDWPTQPNLHLVCAEGFDARLLGPRTFHMRTGTYPAPWRTAPKTQPERLMIWASANQELSVRRVHDQFEDTLAENNPWGLDAGRIRRVAERLRTTTITHGLSAMADAMDLSLAELVVEPSLIALCALDSTLKRYRRVKVVKALRGLPVDIFGQNWAQHVGDVDSFRLLTPNPNHNHVFSYVVQQYAGLVNFDPNFGDGTNERAITALAMGVPIANNVNLSSHGLPGCYSYHFDDASIRDAAERVLAHRDPVPTPAGHTWEEQLGRLLRQIAERKAGAAQAVPAASAAAPTVLALAA